MEYWNIIKPARNFSEKVTFSRTIFFLMITKLFVCLFVFVNALKSYTVLLLHCFYTVDRYNQNCCTNFFLWIFLSMQINSFFFTIYWFFFFVEIVEKLEQSSSWKFFYSKKAHFGTFSQYLAIFLIDDWVAVRWNRFLFFFSFLSYATGSKHYFLKM